ncbi:hypothetical protein BDW59DRAFT_147392 [Aspergillus cavernicola]|uniref:Uncharacterized protein n=1 Tax=Aspergillus cavernicola TaxID=176166 RepID=A0ABR4I9N4_9EURO
MRFFRHHGTMFSTYIVAPLCFLSYPSPVLPKPNLKQRRPHHKLEEMLGLLLHLSIPKPLGETMPKNIGSHSSRGFPA